jgi:hypothetical protein
VGTLISTRPCPLPFPQNSFAGVLNSRDRGQIGPASVQNPRDRGPNGRADDQNFLAANATVPPASRIPATGERIVAPASRISWQRTDRLRRRHEFPRPGTERPRRRPEFPGSGRIGGASVPNSRDRAPNGRADVLNSSADVLNSPADVLNSPADVLNSPAAVLNWCDCVLNWPDCVLNWRDSGPFGPADVQNSPAAVASVPPASCFGPQEPVFSVSTRRLVQLPPGYRLPTGVDIRPGRATVNSAEVPGDHTSSPSIPSGALTPSQPSIAGNRSTVRSGAGGIG